MRFAAHRARRTAAVSYTHLSYAKPWATASPNMPRATGMPWMLRRRNPWATHRKNLWNRMRSRKIPLRNPSLREKKPRRYLRFCASRERAVREPPLRGIPKLFSTSRAKKEPTLGPAPFGNSFFRKVIPRGFPRRGPLRQQPRQPGLLPSFRPSSWPASLPPGWTRQLQSRSPVPRQQPSWTGRYGDARG